jgi:hypothetical protein
MSLGSYPRLLTRMSVGVGIGLTSALMAMAVAGATGPPASPPGPAAVSPEYEVKAAFLYNFAKFVEWPTDTGLPAGSSLELCVLGEDPFGEALDRTVAGKVIDDRTLAARRLGSVQDVPGCAILFVGASEGRRLAEVLGHLRGRPVLTVSDADGFAEAGGMIGLFIENSRVRFAINVGAAASAHLTISSRLLSLARIVQSGPEGQH